MNTPMRHTCTKQGISGRFWARMRRYFKNTKHTKPNIGVFPARGREGQRAQGRHFQKRPKSVNTKKVFENTTTEMEVGRNYWGARANPKIP
jgi:hypothetical protein